MDTLAKFEDLLKNNSDDALQSKLSAERAFIKENRRNKELAEFLVKVNCNSEMPLSRLMLSNIVGAGTNACRISTILPAALQQHPDKQGIGSGLIKVMFFITIISLQPVGTHGYSLENNEGFVVRGMEAMTQQIELKWGKTQIPIWEKPNLEHLKSAEPGNEICFKREVDLEIIEQTREIDLTALGRYNEFVLFLFRNECAYTFGREIIREMKISDEKLFTALKFAQNEPNVISSRSGVTFDNNCYHYIVVEEKDQLILEFTIKEESGIFSCQEYCRTLKQCMTFNYFPLSKNCKIYNNITLNYHPGFAIAATRNCNLQTSRALTPPTKCRFMDKPELGFTCPETISEIKNMDEQINQKLETLINVSYSDEQINLIKFMLNRTSFTLNDEVLLLTANFPEVEAFSVENIKNKINNLPNLPVKNVLLENLKQTETFIQKLKCNEQHCFVWNKSVYMFKINQFLKINRSLSTHLKFVGGEWQKHICDLSFQDCETAIILKTYKVGSTKIINDYIDGEFCTILYSSGEDNITISSKSLMVIKNSFQINIVNHCSQVVINNVKLTTTRSYQPCKIKNQILFEGQLITKNTESELVQFRKNNTEQQTNVFMYDMYNEVIQYTFIFITAFLMIILKCKQNTSCLLYTSPSPRDGLLSRMPSSA